MADRGHAAAEMMFKTTKILLVEDNPGDARLLREMLAEIRDHTFELNWVTSLSQARASLAAGGIDLVILDLGLPDSQGFDTFIRAYEQGSHLPFLVLTGLADENLGGTAVRYGAQDYLVKGEVTSSLLDRAIRYAIERKRAEEAIKERENQLTTIYENAPLIMMLVDRDRRVCKANQLAAQFAGASAADLVGRPGGDALRCLHALDDPQGCGFGPHCQYCAVRLTIIETFETGRSHQQVEACLPFSVEGQAQELTFLLCTACLSVQGNPQVLVTIQDITQRKQAERKLRESEENLRFLAYQLLSAQERERRRISNELHDELGHALLTLKLNLRAIEKGLHPDQQALANDLESLLRYIDGVVENVRRLYLDLTPGDIEDLGLTTALGTLIDEFAANNRTIRWSVNLINIDDRFSLQGQTAIYRIFQEILTNIGKHANPSQVTVSIKEKDKKVLFEIKDDGRGFACAEAGNYPKKGMGLLAMEERIRMLGGTLEVWGQKDQGTRITFSIPISEGGKAD